MHDPNAASTRREERGVALFERANAGVYNVKVGADDE
jgi:hypothetical protein